MSNSKQPSKKPSKQPSKKHSKQPSKKHSKQPSKKKPKKPSKKHSKQQGIAGYSLDNSSNIAGYSLDNSSSVYGSRKSLELPTINLKRKKLSKGDLFIKSFSNGLCSNMINFHTTLGKHGIPRRQATNNTQINSRNMNDSKIVRQSCIQNTFNYIMPLNEYHRVLDYYIPNMDGDNSSLLCLKLNNNIDIIEVNLLTETNLKEIITRFLSTPNRNNQVEKFRIKILRYFSIFKTGKYFNKDFTDFLIKVYPDSWSLPNSQYNSPEYIISKVLFILFKFIFGINMTVLEQIKFLENIIDFCNLDTTDYENKKDSYGWSLCSLLGKNNDLKSWATLFKNNPKSKDYYLTGQRCSYNGFDQLFCFVCCQIDEYGYNYIDKIKEIFPDSGNEISLFTNNYVSKTLGNKDIYSCLLSYIHRKRELYLHKRSIKEENIRMFKEIIKIATVKQARKAKRRKTRSLRATKEKELIFKKIEAFN